MTPNGGGIRINIIAFVGTISHIYSIPKFLLFYVLRPSIIFRAFDTVHVAPYTHIAST